jgi:hypothetical protein
VLRQPLDDAHVALGGLAEDLERLLVAGLSWAATAFSTLSNSMMTRRWVRPAS